MVVPKDLSRAALKVGCLVDKKVGRMAALRAANSVHLLAEHWAAWKVDLSALHLAVSLVAEMAEYSAAQRVAPMAAMRAELLAGSMAAPMAAPRVAETAVRRVVRWAVCWAVVMVDW